MPYSIHKIGFTYMRNKSLPSRRTFILYWDIMVGKNHCYRGRNLKKSKRCRVCKEKFIKGTRAKSCKECRDFDILASAIFNNPKREVKVNREDFPNIGSLARYFRGLYEEQQKRCKYTGYLMYLPYTHAHLKRTGNICSPDRINPRGMYQKGNIALILSRINIMKNDIESEVDFYNICKMIIKYFEEEGTHSKILTPEEIDNFFPKK
nr:hypothetical protein [Bacillus cereus]